MDTEKQRLTESRNIRSEQLLVVLTESLTNREWLPGELLSGSECRMPDWFLDISVESPAYGKYIRVHIELFATRLRNAWLNLTFDLSCLSSKTSPRFPTECTRAQAQLHYIFVQVGGV